MTEGAAQERPPRPPTLLDAMLPVIVLIVLIVLIVPIALIVLIALTIALFGISATDGPLQVALLLSAAFASLMALKNRYAAIADAAMGSDHGDECHLHRFSTSCTGSSVQGSIGSKDSGCVAGAPPKPATPGVAVDFGGDAGTLDE